MLNLDVQLVCSFATNNVLTNKISQPNNVSYISNISELYKSRADVHVLTCIESTTNDVASTVLSLERQCLTTHIFATRNLGNVTCYAKSKNWDTNMSYRNFHIISSIFLLYLWNILVRYLIHNVAITFDCTSPHHHWCHYPKHFIESLHVIGKHLMCNNYGIANLYSLETNSNKIRSLQIIFSNELFFFLRCHSCYKKKVKLKYHINQQATLRLRCI